MKYLNFHGFSREHRPSYAAPGAEPAATLSNADDADLLARNKQLAVVREIAIGVDKVRTIAEAMSLATEQARDIEGIRFVFVQQVDETGEFVITPYFSRIRSRLAVKAIKAAGLDVEKGMKESGAGNKFLRFPLEKFKLARDFIGNPRVMVVPSIAEVLDGVWPKALCDSIQKIMGVKRIVIVPLMVDGEAWGSMHFYLDEELPIDVLVMIAAHCSLAIKNIITVDNLEQRNEELSATQARLKISEERYRLIFESGNDIVLLLDKKGKIIDANQNILKLSGYSREEIIGNNFRVLTKIMPKKSIAIVAKNFLLRMVGVNSPPYEIEIYHSSGKLLNIEITAVPVKDSDGNIIGTLSTLRDITELKYSTRAVRESEEKFSTAFQFNPNACSISSLEDGRYLEINDSFTRITGFTREEAIGSTARQLNLWVGDTDGEKIRPLLRKRGSASDVEISFRTKAGEIRHGIYSGEIVKLSGVECVLVNINDITDRKRMEDELRTAMVEADAANRAKSDFLARMSHEIRTPIHGIKGSLDLLRDTSLAQEQRQYLSMARTSADTLLTLIEEILDFSKIEAGKMELVSVDFEPRKIVEEALSNIAILAHKKGLEVVLEVAPDVPVTVIGDAGRLRQVLINLLGNAVKFTEQGEIVLSAGVVGSGGEAVELGFSVKDTGIGIPEEKHGMIFHPFEQVDGSASRSYGGSGLGLAICQQLVTMMQGRIRFTSQPGEGSVFSFTAQFGKPASGEDGDGRYQLPPELRGLPVLLVDDNASSRSTVKDILDRWGCRVTETDNIGAALEAVENGGDTPRSFSIVLLDETLPHTHGLDAAEQMLCRPAVRPGLVMMITSENVSDRFSRCQELGIAHYLVKPVKETELLEVVLSVLDHARTERAGGRPVAPVPPGVSAPKLRILVAEDNPISQVIAKTALEKIGHTVQIAVDGTQAVHMAKEQDFDLILMDVEMPEMDGLSATRAIRKSEKESGGHVPIFAMTAYAMQEDRQKCLDAGMDAYLSKPLNLDDLYSTITEMSLARDTGTDMFDVEAALEVVGGDESILKQVIGVFLEQVCPEQLGRLREGIDNGDAPAVRVAAHSIKGSARSFGSAALARTALLLEEKGRNGALEGAPALLQQLEREVKQFAEAFSRYDGMKA